MELSQPATTLHDQEQHQQCDELGFQTDQHTTTDHLQALCVLPQEDEGDCKDGNCVVENDDDHQSWRSDVNGGHQIQSDEKQLTDGDISNDEKQVTDGDISNDEDVIGNGGGLMVERGKFSSSRPNQFPVRPEAERCSFYLRTGSCKFGMNYKFDHPLRRKPLSVKIKDKAKDESSEQINCKYFDRPEGCKYGKACKYSHNKHFEPNFLGLPIRPGEKECPYYMRNGSCKYGSNCRFNYPNPATSERSDGLPMYRNSGPVASLGGPQSPLAPWSSSAAINDTTSYVPLLFPSIPGVPSSSEWNSFQAPFYPYETNMPLSPAYTVNNNPLLEANIYAQWQQMPVDEFPERPGQPLCSYYVRTGDCKYKSACKFHHPKNRVSKSLSYALSNLGLPLRPDQSICSHYSRYGICKFGPACKYDHPENYAHLETSVVLELHPSAFVGNSMYIEDTVSVGT